MKILVIACASLLLASPVASQVVNGNFEAGAVGGAPPGWIVSGGTATLANAPDCLFPSTGQQYLVLDSAGTGGIAVAGVGPWAAGAVGQVKQVVMRPPGTYCTFEIDWEWLPAEALGNAMTNDFLTIDIVNDTTGVPITNVVFIDTGVLAGPGIYSNVPGAGAGALTWVPNQSTTFPVATANQAPAGFKRAFRDLSAQPVGTMLRIEISVGNVGSMANSSRAFIDRVRLSGGERNQTLGLRVLSSAHVDGTGTGTSTDWGGDARPETPYDFRTAPGQRLSLRATGAPGSTFVVVAGALKNPGVDDPIGQINIDITAPYLFLIDGTGAFLPPNPLSLWQGTITYGTNFYDFQVPDTVPFGTTITLQGASASSGTIDLTAATTIGIGPPELPVGSVALGGGANQDDGSTAYAFGVFGMWPFYGMNYAGIHVGSNGNVTFGAADTSSQESEAGMLTGPPRIAVVWDDLYPPGAGTTRVTESPTTFTVSWTMMEEFVTGLNGNNFSVQLYKAAGGQEGGGAFTIYYGSTTMDDGLVGVSPGNLAAPAPGVVESDDWSDTAYSLGNRGIIAPGNARFERFAFSDIAGLFMDKFDLMTLGGGPSRITFVPDGNGGYTFFTGTR